MAVRAQVVVRGIVQGVGFRPFVYRLDRPHLAAVIEPRYVACLDVRGHHG
jgi:hypothetical protein